MFSQLVRPLAQPGRKTKPCLHLAVSIAELPPDLNGDLVTIFSVYPSALCS